MQGPVMFQVPGTYSCVHSSVATGCSNRLMWHSSLSTAVAVGTIESGDGWTRSLHQLSACSTAPVLQLWKIWHHWWCTTSCAENSLSGRPQRMPISIQLLASLHFVSIALLQVGCNAERLLTRHSTLLLLCWGFCHIPREGSASAITAQRLVLIAHVLLTTARSCTHCILLY